MKKLYLSLICILYTGYLPAQTNMTLMELTALDSTSSSFAFFRKPDGGLFIGTRQNRIVNSSSTIILTDSVGQPVSAYTAPVSISSAVRCSDGGYLMLADGILKTDSLLNIQWYKRDTLFLSVFLFTSIAEKNGYCYAAGSLLNSIIDPQLTFYATHASIILKFDLAGNLVDHVNLGDTLHSSQRYNYYQPTLYPSDDGSLYVTTSLLQYWASGTCNRHPAILKLDNNLDVIWSKKYIVNLFNGLSGLRFLSDGNLALYGDFGNNYPYCTKFRPYLHKLDTAGNVLWSREYSYGTSLSHGTSSMIELNDNSLVFARAFEDTVAGRYIPVFDHLDANGVILSSRQLTYPYGQFNFQFLLTSELNGIIPAYRINSRDTMLIMTFDTTLAMECNSIPNNYIDSALAMVPEPFLPVNLSYQIYLYDDTSGNFVSTPVSSMEACVSTTAPQILEQTFKLFPNPTSGKFEIQLSGTESTIDNVALISAEGKFQQLSGKKNNSRSTAFDISDVTPGIYVLRIETNGQVIHRKMVRY
jgi:hypothetical protein